MPSVKYNVGTHTQGDIRFSPFTSTFTFHLILYITRVRALAYWKLARLSSTFALVSIN